MKEYLPQGSALNELMRESFLLNRSIREAAQQLTNGFAITGAQWGVLSALGQSAVPRTVAETARRMGLARQSVQRVADLLAGHGLVRYLPNPADRRTKLAEVTDAGRSLLAKLEADQRTWMGRIVGDHGEHEIELAARLIKEIRQRVSSQLTESKDSNRS